MDTEQQKKVAAIPVDELLHDFHEASKDLQAAEIAVKSGAHQYQYRIDGNKRHLQVIQGEIKRRLEVSSELRAACKMWLEHFDELERHSDPDDPLSRARKEYHHERVELTRIAVAKADGVPQ